MMLLSENQGQEIEF